MSFSMKTPRLSGTTMYLLLELQQSKLNRIRERIPIKSGRPTFAEATVDKCNESLLVATQLSSLLFIRTINVNQMLVSQTNYFLKILFSCFNRSSSKINYFINKLEIMICWFAGFFIIYGKGAQYIFVSTKYGSRPA